MFEEVAPAKYATLLTTATGVVNVVMTLACIPLIEKMGRRKLLLLSSIGTSTSMGVTLLCCIFGVGESTVVPCMIIVFIMSFAIGWGGTLWVYLSDIYPADIKVGRTGERVENYVCVSGIACRSTTRGYVGAAVSCRERQHLHELLGRQ